MHLVLDRLEVRRALDGIRYCREDNVGIALLDIAMMTFGGEAQQRTEEEYNELFAATRFSQARVVATGTAFSILEARPS